MAKKKIAPTRHSELRYIRYYISSWNPNFNMQYLIGSCSYPLNTMCISTLMLNQNVFDVYLFPEREISLLKNDTQNSFTDGCGCQIDRPRAVRLLS